MHNDNISPVTKHNRRVLLLVVGVFVLPIALAALFKIAPQWLPNKTKNHGELITPARELPEFNLVDNTGKPFTRASLRGKWNILFIGGVSCTAECGQTLYTIRQARLAQGANVDRVGYVYLMDAAQLPSNLTSLFEQHPDMLIVTGPDSERQKLIEQLRGPMDNGQGAQPVLYLVDPLQRVMMRYKTGFRPKGLIKDLELLVKLP
ncbi:MAG: SCO family protein [Gammaproteobacteria bacterium]|nr:SCO family protein [Gammaproteobacteria bacterium]